MQVKDQNHDSSKINLKVRIDQYQLFFANAALVYRRLVSYIHFERRFCIPWNNVKRLKEYQRNWSNRWKILHKKIQNELVFRSAS